MIDTDSAGRGGPEKVGIGAMTSPFRPTDGRVIPSPQLPGCDPSLPQNFGSQQLRFFRRAYRDQADIDAAARAAGISTGEARLIVADDTRNPPPPEAYELLGQSMQRKEDEMARTARKPPEDGEIKTKDFAGAMRLYRNDIRPAQSKVGEFAQEQSTAFKAIKKGCGIQPSAAKAVFKLIETEEAKRDDWIRCFVGLCEEAGIPLQSADLVDVAEGKAPVAKPAAKPKLVTVGGGAKPPADDSDLADPSGVEPTSGASAAAIAAMRADHAKDKAEEDAAKFDEASEEELAQQEGRGAEH